jgi:predicted dehydrogenase
MIIQASRMGKNILVEKPLTIELDEGKTALKAVKDEKVQLCVVFNYRMVPAVRETRRKIKLGKIARIVSMVGISHTPFPVSWTGGKWLYHYGGALDDFGPHLIDLILWLNPSKLEAVSALGGDFTGDFGFISQIQVNMKFRDTSVAVADISWLTDLTLFDLSVYGTAGSLSCDVRNNYHNETHGRILSPLEDLASTSKKSFNVVKSVISGEYFRGSLAYHSQIISEYMQSIKDKSKPPISGEEALLVTAVSAAAKQSLRTGRTVLIDDIMK